MYSQKGNRSLQEEECQEDNYNIYNNTITLGEMTGTDDNGGS